MKVKVGDTVYDGTKVPVMVILTEEDKKNIAAMTPEQTRYCQFPDGIDREGQQKIRYWMDAQS